jgi:hypothetical protein
MKTLAEVEPRTPVPGGTGAVLIVLPGAYYLAGNRTAGSGSAGITLAAGTSLDLNGFTVTGVAGALDGITVTGNNVTIKNGTVTGFPGDGIDGGIGTNVHVVGVTSVNNTGAGFRLGGTGAHVLACSASGNGANGYESTNQSGIFENCSAVGNGTAGAANGFLVQRAVLRGCSANTNAGDGFDAGVDSSIIGCIARGNTNAGIQVTGSAVIESNQCDTNNGYGIQVLAAGALVKGNNCTGNGIGVSSIAASIVINNPCSANTTNFNLAAGTRAGAIDVLTTTGEIQTNAIANFEY